MPRITYWVRLWCSLKCVTDCLADCTVTGTLIQGEHAYQDTFADSETFADSDTSRYLQGTWLGTHAARDSVSRSEYLARYPLGTRAHPCTHGPAGTCPGTCRYPKHLEPLKVPRCPSGVYTGIPWCVPLHLLVCTHPHPHVPYY